MDCKDGKNVKANSTSKKLSFSEAAADLEILCEQIDDGADINQLVTQLFNRAQDELKDAVDRRIKFIKYAESQVVIAKEMRDEWAARAKRFEKAMEYIKNNTKEVIKANPNIPYKGTIGGFKLYKNSQPSLKLIDEVFDELDYVKVVEETVFESDRLRQDLKDGKIVMGASLEYGEHLRISLL